MLFLLVFIDLPFQTSRLPIVTAICHFRHKIMNLSWPSGVMQRQRKASLHRKQVVPKADYAIISVPSQMGLPCGINGVHGAAGTNRMTVDCHGDSNRIPAPAKHSDASGRVSQNDGR